MKALILNSGIGKRMGKLTKDKPKCLISIENRETLLGRQLKILVNNGITDVIITTGHFEEKIRDYIRINFPGLNVKYVYNPQYASTNYIYSLFLTKDLIDDDIILIHGDMVFEENLFKELLRFKHKNAVLVNNKIEPPIKDFKGRIQDGMVKEISVNIFGENCFFLAPIYKFSKKSFLLWLQEIEKFVEKGEVNVYAENAFNVISSEIELNPLYFSNELCMEVDNEIDIEIAKKFLINRGEI